MFFLTLQKAHLGQHPNRICGLSCATILKTGTGYWPVKMRMITDQPVESRSDAGDVRWHREVKNSFDHFYSSLNAISSY